MDSVQANASLYAKEIKSAVGALKNMRTNPDNPKDVSLGDYVKKRWAISLEGLFNDLGLNPYQDTIDNMVNLPDPDVHRWLMPEVIREAVRLGLRKSPIYPNITALEQTVKQLQLTMPSINMSDAMPHKVGVAETIPLGNISYQKKQVSIWKMGRGLRIPYEIRQYVTLNITGIFFQDFGVKLGMGLDAMAIDVLINGEQTDGSASAPVVGVDTVNTTAYKDLLRVWVRMGRLGRTPNAIIGGEDSAIATLNLDEFKKRESGTPEKRLNMKTPVPSVTDYYVHGAVPDEQQIILDTTSALIKLNAQPLMIEEKKEVSNQTMEFYASLTTGFSTLFRDARVIVDQNEDIDDTTFPSYMDPTSLETATIVE